MCVCLSVCVCISTFLTLFESTLPQTEHVSWLKVKWENKASVGSQCVWVHSGYGKIINLLTQLKTESAIIHAVYFTWAFTAIQDVNAFYGDIVKCYQISFESYFLFK